jgi:hypothetical protein
MNMTRTFKVIALGSALAVFTLATAPQAKAADPQRV